MHNLNFFLYSVLINIITVTSIFSLDSEEEDGASPKTSNNQLGMMSSICLDNVYMNYLQKKSEQKAKKKKKTKNTRPSKSQPHSPQVSSPQVQHINKNMNKNNDELLLRLMQKNTKEGEFTAEQKSLHESYDVLMAEYQRRKDQRQKVGGIFRNNKRNLRDILKDAMSKRGVSDLALKARSQDLQRLKIENKKKRITSFATIVDADKI